MPKKMNLNASRKPSKGSTKDSQFGRDLISGAKQILAHVEGRKVLKEYEAAGPVDVKAIRESVGMSQSEFATAYHLNRRTLQQWEQGKSSPDLAVRAYLKVIRKNPQIVAQSLREAS